MWLMVGQLQDCLQRVGEGGYWGVGGFGDVGIGVDFVLDRKEV